MACVVLGDSIAVGVGQNMPDCEVSAKVGINSDRYIATLMPPGHLDVESAVISLGVNDDATIDTLSNLRDVRSRITSRAVTWLLPGLKDEVRSMIRTVASEYGDRTIDTRPQVGPDHLHPTGTGYRIIANAVGDGVDDTEVADYEPQPSRATSYRRTRYSTVVQRIHGLRALRQAELRQADLRHADLRQTDLRRADFRRPTPGSTPVHGRATHLVQHVSQAGTQHSMHVAVRLAGAVETRHTATVHPAAPHPRRVRS